MTDKELDEKSVDLMNLFLSFCDDSEVEKYIDVKWIDDLQYKIIQNIEFSMGGRKIQEFDSEFLYSSGKSL